MTQNEILRSLQAINSIHLDYLKAHNDLQRQMASNEAGRAVNQFIIVRQVISALTEAHDRILSLYNLTK